MWVKIDDKFPQHPKIASAGPLAIAMQVAGLCYCNRELTDGFIPRSIARTLLDWQIEREDGRLFTIAVTCGMMGDDLSSQWVIDLLCETGMWEEVIGGYQIHDYLDYQPSREQVLAERDQAKERMQRVRETRRANKGSDVPSNAKRSSGEVRANNGRSSTTPVTRSPSPVVLAEQVNPPLVPPKGKTTKRKSQIPDSFPVTDEMYAYGQKQGMDAARVDEETERFTLYHRSRGSLFLDWSAAWQGWIRRAPEFQRNVTPFNGNGRQSAGAQLLAKYNIPRDSDPDDQFIDVEAKVVNR